MPLLLAASVIANSRTTEATLLEVVPRLASRIRRVSNGVEAPDREPAPPSMQPPFRLTVVGRLSPRKAPDVALEAAALLRAAATTSRSTWWAHRVEGMEWFEEQLVTRAAQPDLAGSVTFSGYASPIWPALDRSDVVLAPSLGESFGNAVVEGQLARRPVVATALQGHLETIIDEETGLLVPSEDPEALAAAVSRLLDEPRPGAPSRGARARIGSERLLAEPLPRGDLRCAVRHDHVRRADDHSASRTGAKSPTAASARLSCVLEVCIV